MCFVALLFTFHLSPFTLNAQCIGIKAEDSQAFAHAVSLIDKRQYKEAGQAMRRVASRNPKAPEPQYWLGIIAAYEGNSTAIRRYFSKCLELCPEYPGALAHYYMGIVHYTDGNYDEAVAALNRYFDRANGSDAKAVLAVYDEASNYLHWSTFLASATLNEAPYDPHRVTGVSSNHDEALPYLTLDGLEFHYLRYMPEKEKTTVYHSEIQVKNWQLYVSGRNGSSFTSGTLSPFTFRLSPSDGGVSITADGNELYCAITSNGNTDIYLVRRVDGRWQQPEALGPQVNSPNAWDAQPTVSPDGSLLLFASNRPGGQGGIDIWRCHRLPNGDWSRAENLGKTVNTMGNEKSPFLAADGRTLYFVSDGWQGFGGYDIFFANLGGDERPTNLGLPINSEADEQGLGVTADGRQAYMTGRVAESRSTDILMFDIYPSARPEPMHLWRMLVTDTLGHPLPATVSLDGGAVYHATADSVSLMLSERADNIITVSVPGYMPGIFRLRANDVVHGRAGKGVALLPMEKDACVRIDLADNEVLTALAKWLIDNPRVRIALECPTKVAAEEAYSFLRLKSIRPDRINYRTGTDIKQKQIRIL